MQTGYPKNTNIELGAGGSGLTVDILLGDVLRPYERGQAPDVPLEHALVHREVQAGPDRRASGAVVGDSRRRQAAGLGFGLCGLVVLLCRRRLDELMVTEDLTGSALAARLGGGEGPGRSLLVRLQ